MFRAEARRSRRSFARHRRSAAASLPWVGRSSCPAASPLSRVLPRPVRYRTRRLGGFRLPGSGRRPLPVACSVPGTARCFHRRRSPVRVLPHRLSPYRLNALGDRHQPASLPIQSVRFPFAPRQAFGLLTCPPDHRSRFASNRSAHRFHQPLGTMGMMTPNAKTVKRKIVCSRRFAPFLFGLFPIGYRQATVRKLWIKRQLGEMFYSVRRQKYYFGISRRRIIPEFVAAHTFPPGSVASET